MLCCRGHAARPAPPRYFVWFSCHEVSEHEEVVAEIMLPVHFPGRKYTMNIITRCATYEFKKVISTKALEAIHVILVNETTQKVIADSRI